MEIGPALAFAGATIVLVGMPGPNNVYISLRSLAQGRRAGLVSALAVETGTLVYAIVAALGLVAVVRAAPSVFTAITIVGASYLAYLGLKVLRAPAAAVAGAVPPQPLGRIFRDGLLVNLLNPKTALFFLAFMPQFTSRDADPGQLRTEMLQLSAAMFVIALMLDFGYALGADAVGRRLGWSGRSDRPAQRYTVAGIYLGLATIAVVGAVHG